MHDSSGDDHGTPRHAAPELDSSTEVIASPLIQGPGLTAASIDRRAKLGAVVAVGVVVVGFGVLGSAGSSHSSSDTTTPTQSARSQGVAYAAELRDEGYNSMTVMGRCDINDGGYSGSYWSDYLDGCAAVALQMDAIQSGR